MAAGSPALLYPAHPLQFAGRSPSRPGLLDHRSHLPSRQSPAELRDPGASEAAPWTCCCRCYGPRRPLEQTTGLGARLSWPLRLGPSAPLPLSVGLGSSGALPAAAPAMPPHRLQRGAAAGAGGALREGPVPRCGHRGSAWPATSSCERSAWRFGSRTTGPNGDTRSGRHGQPRGSCLEPRSSPRRAADPLISAWLPPAGWERWQFYPKRS